MQHNKIHNNTGNQIQFDSLTSILFYAIEQIQPLDTSFELEKALF